MHPSYLGFQADWPLFVKTPLSADGKEWKRDEHFNWLERGIEVDKVARLYASGYLHHNTDLEIQSKVGDRLSEMNGNQLKTLVTLINAEVKKRTSSTNEFESKRCKQSTLDDKQRGLIRRFLVGNRWIMDDFYKMRDTILGE